MTSISPDSYRAALYMRLSKEDGNCESTSITNQRKLLRRYAKDQGFIVEQEFCDDGWSGTSFDRPAFKEMIAAIEAGRINLVLVKDLSRLGRDYIATGQYTELYFPSRQVRCIAVNDGYDSFSCDTDLIPFKNVMNEMYARDISRKIRSSLKSRMDEGAFIGNFPPYGYQRSLEDRHSLAPDKLAAPVVKEIFFLAFLGNTTGEIAKKLNQKNIPCPSLYRLIKYPSHCLSPQPERVWTGNTILKILHNPVYLGHMAQGKTRKVSFKSTNSLSVPASQWTVVSDTHEPLVEETIFFTVQSALSARRFKRSSGFSNLLSSFAYCCDCGHGMSTYGGRSPIRRLVCGSYKSKGSSVCSSHSIPYKDLCAIILSELTEQLKLLNQYQQYLCNRLIEQISGQKLPLSFSVETSQHSLESLKCSLSILYEDRLAGRISADEYDSYAKRIHHLMETERPATVDLISGDGQPLDDKQVLKGGQILVDRQVPKSSSIPAVRQGSPSPLTRETIENLVERFIHPQALTLPLITHFVKRIEIGPKNPVQKIHIFITPDDHPWQWALDAMLPELWDAVSSILPGKGSSLS